LTLFRRHESPLPNKSFFSRKLRLYVKRKTETCQEKVFFRKVLLVEKKVSFQIFMGLKNFYKIDLKKAATKKANQMLLINLQSVFLLQSNLWPEFQTFFCSISPMIRKSSHQNILIVNQIKKLV